MREAIIRAVSTGEINPETGRSETELERLDRNLNELFMGLRVALPGVQVLFAFLLVLPFQSGFPDVTAFQEKVYFATLLCTMIASVILIAPSARHRIRFRKHDKAYVVFTASRLTIPILPRSPRPMSFFRTRSTFDTSSVPSRS